MLTQGLLGVGEVAGTVVLLLGQAAPGRGIELAEQFGGLVEQRHVGLGPRRIRRRAAARRAPPR